MSRPPYTMDGPHYPRPTLWARVRNTALAVLILLIAGAPYLAGVIASAIKG